ncbi:phosphatidate cytidylyltransferase [Brachybacterium sp. AOP25-B2-12]|uniref:phosphatidate cytidylyltransferase n=1 Tax=Brachybacterium sp. AOP25-B2-12 TaxID=3457710 RepID=UPI004033239D
MPSDPGAAPVDPEASPPRRRGAGRNLPAAIGVGLGLGALLLLSLFVVPIAIVPLVGLGLVLGTFECVRALDNGGLRVPLVPVLVGAVGMVVSTEVFGVDGLVVSMAVSISVVLVWRVLEATGLATARDVAAGVFTLAWVPFLGCFVLLLHSQPNGAFLVLLALVVPIMNDIGGYIAGVLFGAHPMAPRISPKKSWEGFFGSMLFGTGSAVAIITLWIDHPWWIGLVIGPVLVLLSTCGDLAESLLKRDLGIKDMGTLLPGHGGVLDRIDSMLLAAPATFILLEVLTP